jgi:Holliday junction resolvase RusA-like endonuclease
VSKFFQATVGMKAFGKARPRVTRYSTYMPKQYVLQSEQLADLVGELPSWCYEAEPVFLRIIATFKMPKSWSKAKKAEMTGKLRPSAPDSDNMQGAVMDALWPRELGGDAHVFSDGERRYWGEFDQICIMIKGEGI